ncbi:hypothetical protein JTE90_028052 [Oedothorax gibbosus]|uniref:RING-CH-type domain-containing protein n=1 Tax=Oedothorax gibbosus TaxID=931172 RepID=A0AAV6UHX8_9ARAC|nr:hypothetical protein JTE90_028052 [Oedothorax gibbosus]
MPLQQIRVTPADRKNTNDKEKVKYETKATEPPFSSAAGSPPPGACMEHRRPSSQPSTVSRSSLGGGADICRICHCESEPDLPLISPCFCAGSLRYVHQSCLQQWIKSSDTRCCELCKFQFIMHTKIKPFTKWEKLEMSPVEQRKVLCSITFHVVAITCVVWSLYVLIDRTAEEMRSGALEWPFWTKLIVVAIGFTGGLVFMYVQCKMYVQLFRRWRAFNRIICVQNAPEKAKQQNLFTAAELTANVLDASSKVPPTSASPEEEEFHSCQSGESSSSSSSTASEDDRGGAKAAAKDTPSSKAGSNGTTLTNVTDTPILQEVVVVAALPPHQDEACALTSGDVLALPPPPPYNTGEEAFLPKHLNQQTVS